MAGDNQLVCKAFIESETFRRSKDDLKQSLGLTDHQVDDRLEALVWALRRDSGLAARRIPNRDLWVAVTPRGVPPLRIYLRPRPGFPEECEWLWVEEKLEG